LFLRQVGAPRTTFATRAKAAIDLRENIIDDEGLGCLESGSLKERLGAFEEPKE